MGKIFYIGFYWNEADGVCRKNIRENIAGTVKMDFILKCLRQFNREIVLVSIMPSKNSGFQHQETIKVSEKETHVYLPALVLRVFGKNVIRGDLGLFFLKQFMLKNVTNDDIVINYHSLIFGNFFLKMRQRIRFRWICEVEELYRLSAEAHKNKELLDQEEKMFTGADGYLFVNDILPQKYSNGAPYAVSYGNYTVFCEETKKKTSRENRIVVVYAGIITEDSGVYLLIRAMQHLSENYQLRIIGMGSEENIKEMFNWISKVNKQTRQEKVKYLGVRTGKALTEFLTTCDIGCSMLNTDHDFSVAFPSKILTYLGHGLKVVTSRSECVQQSSLSDLLFFCDNNETSLAKTIKEAARSRPTGCSQRLRDMETLFCKQLEEVLGVSRQ